MRNFTYLLMKTNQAFEIRQLISANFLAKRETDIDQVYKEIHNLLIYFWGLEFISSTPIFLLVFDASGSLHHHGSAAHSCLTEICLLQLDNKPCWEVFRIGYHVEHLKGGQREIGGERERELYSYFWKYSTFYAQKEWAGSGLVVCKLMSPMFILSTHGL